jgi:hypothetical protein
MKKLALVFAAVSAIALGACKKEEGAKPADTKPADTTAKPADTTAKPADPKPADPAPAAPAAADGEVGIAECDAFVKAYRACVEKMPEAARGPANDGLKQMVDAWKQAASQGDAAKDALKTGCKSAYDNSKQAMAAACPDVKWE